MSRQRVVDQLSGLLLGVFVGTALFAIAARSVAPKYTVTTTGWRLEHIPMPVCPNDHKRWTDIPERDEVDAFTLVCEKTPLAVRIGGTDTKPIFVSAK